VICIDEPKWLHLSHHPGGNERVANELIALYVQTRTHPSLRIRSLDQEGSPPDEGMLLQRLFKSSSSG
jgi:hypothetical protein